jgi:excisionase family DNA binding protein
VTTTNVTAEPFPAGPDATGVASEDIEHFNIAQAAKRLGFGKRSLAEMVRLNQVPHTRVGPAGKLVRFRRDHLLAISRAGDVNPATRGRKAA